MQITVGAAGRRRSDRAGDAAFDFAALGVDALQVGDKIMGELEYRLRHRGMGRDAVDDRDRLAGPQLLGYLAGDELAEHHGRPTHCLGALRSTTSPAQQHLSLFARAAHPQPTYELTLRPASRAGAVHRRPDQVNRQSVRDILKGTATIVGYMMVVKARRTLDIGGASIDFAVL
jgi:hypothetical protein